MWESAIGEFLGSFVGVLGALLVFWLGVRHSRRQEQARLEREYMSTLKLLLDDLLQHKNALEKYASNQAWVWADPLPPNTTIWEETRWRVVQVGVGSAWSDLATYYASVRSLEEWRNAAPKDTDDPRIATLLTRMQQRNEHLIEEIEETLLTGVEGQDHRLWWRRVFGT